MPTRDEVDTCARFAARYSREEPLLAQLEREVMGSDHGANGYTTVAQADELARILALRRGERLLDVGSGCGWPGLHIAARSGCDVVLTDVISSGMRRARRRIQVEGLDGSSALLASARHLPFRRGSFDAVTHADVLC